MPPPRSDHLAPLFPAGAGVLCDAGPDTGDPDALPDVERQAISRAVESRRREFAAGRALARSLISRLGAPPGPIPVGPSRAPVWPRGIVGSIAHTAGVCVAAAGHEQRTRSIGIDVEPDAPLKAELWEPICTPAEQTWISSQPPEIRGKSARLLFSAKESLFKCLHPVTGVWVDFRDVTVTIHPAGRFVPEFLGPACAPGWSALPWCGRWVRAEGWILTAATLPA